MLEIISHRGNLHGPGKEQNCPEQLEKALKLFKVEVDVWYNNDRWYLGHDKPQYEISQDFFNEGMYLHCKNIEAVEQLSDKKYNWFWHENDHLTLTSHGIIWCYPNNYIKNGITVLQEMPSLELLQKIPKNIKGLCTDYPLELRKLIE